MLLLGSLQEYINAPHDASGDPPADVKPYFKGPYFEWWNSVQVSLCNAMYLR